MVQFVFHADMTDKNKILYIKLNTLHQQKLLNPLLINHH